MIELFKGPNVNAEQAQTNRENIELELMTVGIAQIPQGAFLLDKSPKIPSGARILGAGMDQTELRNFLGDKATLEVQGEGLGIDPDPNGWCLYGRCGKTEIRRDFDGSPTRPLTTASEDKQPLGMIDNVRIEGLTIAGSLSARYTAGLSLFRVRVLGSFYSLASTNLRVSYSEIDVLDAIILEDSVFDANRFRSVYANGKDISFRDFRVLQRMALSGLGFSLSDGRIDGVLDITDANRLQDSAVRAKEWVDGLPDDEEGS